MKTRNKFLGRIGKVVAFKCAVIRLLGKLRLLDAQRTRAFLDYVLVEGSDLFCADWYLQANPDVARAKCDPVWHYCNYGGKEGRAPSPAFDGNDYLKRYPDVRKKGMIPLLHYLRHGAKEHRLFRPIRTAFSAFEWMKGYVLRSGLFDAKWCGMSVSDYLRTGWERGIDPSRGFSTVGYFALNPDVAKAKICPLVHYLLCGQYEGRSWDMDDQAVKRLVAEADKRHGQLSLHADFPFPHSAVPVFWKRSPRCGKHGRLAVFAAYSKDGTIPDTTLYYLRGLCRVVDDIVFVSDNPVLPSEVDKIKELVCCAWCERHEEYDFGSYKRGWRYVMGTPELRGCSEIVFCNDSCYGPVVPFAGVFDAMKQRECDFWGMCSNREVALHLQSYFLLMKQKVFRSQVFARFMADIHQEESVRDIILRYEVPFAKTLADAGFRYDSFISQDENLGIRELCENPVHWPVSLLTRGCPLVKSKAFHQVKSNLEGIEQLCQTVEGLNPELMALIRQREPIPCLDRIRFSVIMPTYNRAACIKRSVDAVLQQTYGRFELIIVDDGSTDDTEQVLAATYEDEIASGRIRYVRKANEGVCKARNVGLAAAKNEWIAYVDSDNRVMPNFLETYATFISGNPDVRCYYARFKMEQSGKVIGKPFCFEALLAGNFIDLGTFVHHRSVYEELGGFDEEMTRLVDWDLIIRYTERFTPVYLDQVVLLYDDRQKTDRISVKHNYFTNLNHMRLKRGPSYIVTTMITTYNHRNYIEKAIRSALKQKGDFIHEILVSDDGSTDGTREIIKDLARRFPTKIRDISQEQNEGVSKNMRRCFSMASGTYIAVLEGDDYWKWDSKLMRQVEFMKKNPDCPMVFCRIDILNQATGRFSLLPRQNGLASKLTGEDFIRDPNQNLIANFSSCMFSAAVAKCFPDILFSVRFNEISCVFYIEKLGPIGFLPMPMTAYRLHPGGIWSAGDKLRKIESSIQVREVALAVCAPQYRERFVTIIDGLKAKLAEARKEA